MKLQKSRSVEKTKHLSSNILSASLVVIHDATGCGEHNEAKLENRKEMTKEWQ